MKKVAKKFKNGVQHFRITFKSNFNEAKALPKSKRKSFMIGFTTAVGIFGLTVFGRALPAIAQDVLPNGGINASTPNSHFATAPTPPPGSEIISTGVAGIAASAASVSALAVTSGSFAIGVAFGCAVVVVILFVQGK